MGVCIKECKGGLFISNEAVHRTLYMSDKQTPVNVELDQSTAYEELIIMIELLKQLSLEKVAILTHNNHRTPTPMG